MAKQAAPESLAGEGGGGGPPMAPIASDSIECGRQDVTGLRARLKQGCRRLAQPCHAQQGWYGPQQGRSVALLLKSAAMTTLAASLTTVSAPARSTARCRNCMDQGACSGACASCKLLAPTRDCVSLAAGPGTACPRP